MSVAVAFSCVASGQSFGRFGYVKSMTIPGFRIDAHGFRVNSPNSDTFRFAIPSIEWTPLSTSAYAQTVRLAGAAGSPARIKAETWALGFSMYVEKGLTLKLSCALPPYLSWEDGSVGTEVPMPPSRWALVSFQNDQPPVTLCFLTGPAELVLKGKTGDYTLTTTKPYKGWIRVIAPTGTEPKAANSAKALGELAKLVTKRASSWIEWPAQLKRTQVDGDPLGVVVRYQFDKPGAVLPYPCLLAPLAGYPLKVKSGYEKTDIVTEEGPVCVSTGAEIAIRLPVRRIPTGRSLPVGTQDYELLGSVSAFDVGTVVELALSNLLGFRDRATRAMGDEVLAHYLAEAAYATEPFSKQQLPFDAKGIGADICAAQALLMQALYSTLSATSEPNALLTSLAWRRDGYTWLFWTQDPVLARRTGALAAIAGALCPEPERRLEGALFEAGIAAQRGLDNWKRRRREIDKEPQRIEPMWSQRAALFSYDGHGSKSDPFVLSLLSDIRVYGENDVALGYDGESLRVKWPAHDSKTTVLTLASAYPIQLKPISPFDAFSAKEALGFTVITFKVKDPSACEAHLIRPAWAPDLPRIAPIPAYSETPR